MEPELVDLRSHRFALAVTALLLLVAWMVHEPWAVVVAAVIAASPLLPMLFSALLGQRLGPPRIVLDRRIPRYARLMGAAGVLAISLLFLPGWTLAAWVLVLASAGECVFGAISGHCIPCSAIVFMARHGLVRPAVPIACPMPIR